MSDLRNRKITTRCWKCREPVEGPVCSSCGSIRPPPAGADLFTVLGLSRRYFIERADLERAYRKVSRKVHPDRYARKSAVERRMSLQWTALVNEARRVIRDPISRARYLATGATAPAEEGGPVLDPDFMETIFDLQMEAAASPAAVHQQATTIRDGILASLEARFTAWEADGGDLSAVEAQLARLKYIDNILSATAS